jgi:putative sterol carrier protein
VTLPRPFTQPWADALHIAINADVAYRTAASNWTWPVALVLDATPDLGYADDTAVEFDLHRGTCASARVLAVPAITAPFVLRAPYAVWKKVVQGLTDPVMAIALRKIAFAGSLSTLMMHAGAAKALVARARTVPTHFPDETG